MRKITATSLARELKRAQHTQSARVISVKGGIVHFRVLRFRSGSHPCEITLWEDRGQRIAVQIGRVTTGVPKVESWTAGDGIFFGADPGAWSAYGPSLIEVPLAKNSNRCYRAPVIPEAAARHFIEQTDIFVWLARAGLKSSEMLVVVPSTLELNLRDRDEQTVVEQFGALRDLAGRFPLTPLQEIDEDDPTD